MKLKFAFFFLCCVQIFSTLNAQDELPPFDLGTVEDGVYTNKFFHCSIAIPRGWQAEIDEDQKLHKKVFDNMSDDNPVHSSQIDAARVKTAILVVISKYEKGAAVSFNPNIIVLVENVSEFPGIRTGADYLFQAEKLLKVTSPDTKIKSKEFIRHDFAKVFYSAKMITKISGIKMKQEMFCTIIDGFTFIMSCTYQTKEDLVELTSVIGSIEFND